MRTSIATGTVNEEMRTADLCTIARTDSDALDSARIQVTRKLSQLSNADKEVVRFSPSSTRHKLIVKKREASLPEEFNQLRHLTEEWVIRYFTLITHIEQPSYLPQSLPPNFNLYISQLQECSSTKRAVIQAFLVSKIFAEIDSACSSGNLESICRDVVGDLCRCLSLGKIAHRSQSLVLLVAHYVSFYRKCRSLSPRYILGFPATGTSFDDRTMVSGRVQRGKILFTIFPSLVKYNANMEIAHIVSKASVATGLCCSDHTLQGKSQRQSFISIQNGMDLL